MTHPSVDTQQPQGAPPAPAKDPSAAVALEERVAQLEEQVSEFATRLDRSDDWHGVYD